MSVCCATTGRQTNRARTQNSKFFIASTLPFRTERGASQKTPREVLYSVSIDGRFRSCVGTAAARPPGGKSRFRHKNRMFSVMPVTADGVRTVSDSQQKIQGRRSAAHPQRGEPISGGPSLRFVQGWVRSSPVVSSRLPAAGGTGEPRLLRLEVEGGAALVR
jgi:hypothetical protein